jgi:predicted outer membrane repeat protein
MRSASLSVATFSLLAIALVACGEEQTPTGPAQAETALEPADAGLRLVNSPADPGQGTCDVRECTLREAIEDPGATTIGFAPGFTGPITLARAGLGGGTLVIPRSLTIVGPDAGVVIERRPSDPAFRIFRVDSGLTVSLRNLTIRNGKHDQQAGGILNFGTLTLVHVKVRNSAPEGIVNRGTLTLGASAVTGSAGAGITSQNDAKLTLNGTTIRGNGARGIVNEGGTLDMYGGTVDENGGTGIYQSWGTSKLIRVKVRDNAGRGIHLWNSNVTVTLGTIARNAGGGIATGRGRLTIDRSTVSGNTGGEFGGGIYCHTAPRTGVEVRVTNSTISGNSAAYGGGIFCEDHTYGSARVYLVNTTVASNVASQAGGGIALVAEESAWLDLTNSLIALNTAPGSPDIAAPNSDYGGVSASYSLLGDGTGSSVPNEGGNQVGNVAPYTAPIDPRIGPLVLNGGTTATHALQVGSPAIDAAFTAACPATDQRGVRRPQGAGCDIGSYERE